MTKRRPKPKLLNEAAFEQRLKKEADQYKIYYFAIAAICLILIVGLLSVTGEVFGFPILVGAMALGMALLVPNRTLVWAVKPRWVEPRIECSRCHGKGWPEDLTPAQTCPLCGNVKIGTIGSNTTGTQSGLRNCFNEATYRRRLKSQAGKVRIVVAIAVAIFGIAVIYLLTTGAGLPPVLYVTLPVLIPGFYKFCKMPDRKLLKPGYPKTTIACSQCGGQGWPEDLTPARTCPICGNDKIGQAISKRAQREAIFRANAPVRSMKSSPSNPAIE